MIALQNMRMACDSSYLLDGTTDHGTKADELITVLDELFERPEVKAVVFSQWVRMLELLARRLKKRGWSHVFFHGGVESAKRKEVVDRFRDDPRCRVFLSTDAGGVGLNLQHASVVVNVDLPWNPAVLEQRIGRVYRLGQTRPVQVVSFVAKAPARSRPSATSGPLRGTSRSECRRRTLSKRRAVTPGATGEPSAVTAAKHPFRQNMCPDA